jgi:hypothetical protein
MNETNADRFSIFVQDNETGEQRCVGWSNESALEAARTAMSNLSLEKGESAWWASYKHAAKASDETLSGKNPRAEDKFQ